MSILSLPDQAGVKNIDWSSDGQLLAVSTNQGALTVYVTKLHSLFAVSAPRIALLSSLTEVSLFHYSPDRVCSQLIFKTISLNRKCIRYCYVVYFHPYRLSQVLALYL